MKKLIVDNKELYIVDNLFDRSFHEYFYGYTSRLKKYNLGFEDTYLVERGAHKYYTADFDIEDIQNVNFFEELFKNKNIKKFLGNKQLIRATVNTSTASQVNFPHTHHNEWSLVYYINTDWKPEWAGETLFYNEDLTEIEYASIYKPNRAILFDGGIAHSIRAQSNIAPEYRLSLAMFFQK